MKFSQLKIKQRVQYVPRVQCRQHWRGASGTVIRLFHPHDNFPGAAAVQLDVRPAEWPYSDDLIFAPWAPELKPI